MVKHHNLIQYGFLQEKRNREYASLGRYLVGLLEQIKEQQELIFSDSEVVQYLKERYAESDEKIKELDKQLSALANDDSEPEDSNEPFSTFVAERKQDNG